jgi:mono/diheme cytochrome c family protein
MLSRIATAVSVLVLGAGFVFAQDDIGVDSIGSMEFQKNCAACHGMSGKGDGPFLEFLKERPSDLTLIAKRNGGVYPVKDVYEWIRDPSKIRAHGTKEMPIWGDRYSQEIMETYGPDYTGPGSSVHERILELVFYVGTLQQ